VEGITEWADIMQGLGENDMGIRVGEKE